MTCEIVNFCTLSSTEQAAWIQAIGSLVAIAIAIFVPLFIEYLKKLQIDKEKNLRSKALALSILPDLYKLRASTSHFEMTNSEAEDSSQVDELNVNYFDHADNFKRILTAMPDLTQFGAKLSGLVYLLFQANEMMAFVSRLQAGGYHAAYNNNKEKFVGLARSIDTAADELITAIERSHDKV